MFSVRVCTSVWLACAWFCVGASALLSTRAAPLTVVTYNIENYTIANRMADGVYYKEYPKPEAEKTALRVVLHSLNADVIALQEVGGQPFLDELLRDLKTEGLVYPFSVVLDSEDKDRKTAVISKIPFAEVKKNAVLTYTYFGGLMKVKRGLLQVRFATGGGENGGNNTGSGGSGITGGTGGAGGGDELTLFVVHLKSRFTERPDDPTAALQRAGEAAAIRDRVLLECPYPEKARFMIVGDFNDGRTVRPVKAMLERGETTISQWLMATDSRGEVWSHFYRRNDSYSRVDHILVSPALMPKVRGGVGRICDISETLTASDHRPIAVVIE